MYTHIFCCFTILHVSINDSRHQKTVLSKFTLKKKKNTQKYVITIAMIMSLTLFFLNSLDQTVCGYSRMKLF